MIKKIVLMLMLVLSTGLSAQFYTISGYITDSKSGESLINASVFDHQSRKGTVSNEFGFFSITLPGGEVDLQFTYVGYQTEKRSFTLGKDTIVSIRLK